MRFLSLVYRARVLGVVIATATVVGAAEVAGTDSRPETGAETGTAAHEATAAWWADLEALASDAMQGRMTGSPEYRKAAEYVARVFEQQGLTPGGANGFYQPVPFVSRRLVPERSSLTLIRDDASTPLEIGPEAIIGLRYDPAPSIEARLTFVGYGLSVPEAGHDDLSGRDLRGAIGVYISGAPSSIPTDLVAHAQSAAERWRGFARAGLVGAIAISPSPARDIPWDRTALLARNPTLRLIDPSLDETPGQQFGATVNEQGAARLLAGSGRSTAELLKLAQAHEPLPRFDLPSRLRATVVLETRRFDAENVVGILPGSDPQLRSEHVVLSAHLDHIGMGEPVDGDRVYNGAMDNASGVATLLDAARQLHAAARTPKRSIVFLAVTAEEQGLLGSRYWTTHPTVPLESLAANVNVDMFLPLFPMRSVIGLGAEESDLGEDLGRAAESAGVAIVPDPEPARRAFIRSDQYSFIRRGIPALALKIGYELNTPEHEIVKGFLRKRYHAPADDLAQPIDRTAVRDFNRLYVALARSIADRPSRPAWKETSRFRGTAEQ